MAREIIFPEQKLAGGRYKLKLDIDNTETPDLIINEDDYSPSGSWNWQPYSGGASLTYESLWGMKVHIDAILSGEYLRNPIQGKHYKLYGYFPNPGNNLSPVDVFVGGVFVGQIESRQTNILVEFYFIAPNNSNILYLKCEDDFYISSINVEEINFAHSVKMGDLTIGNDNDIDWVMYPGNFNLQFKVQPDYNSSSLWEFNKWVEVQNALTRFTSTLTIYKFKDDIWQIWTVLTVDPDDINSEAKTKVFKIRTLDAISSIKNPWASRTNPNLFYVNRYTLQGFLDVLLGLIGNIGEHIFKSNWLVRDDENIDDYHVKDCYISDLGLMYPEGLPFNTIGDQVKALLNNISSYFLLAPYYKKIIMPLQYDGSPITPIYANEMPPIESFQIKKYFGINSYIHSRIVDYTVGRDYILSDPDKWMQPGNNWRGDNGGTVEQNDDRFITVQDGCILDGTSVGQFLAGHTYTIGFKVAIITATNVKVGINGSAELLSVSDDGGYYVTFVASTNGNTVRFWGDGTFTLWYCSIDDGVKPGQAPTQKIDGYLDVYYAFPLDGATTEVNYPTITINESGTHRAKLWGAKYKKRDGTYSEYDSFTNHSNKIIPEQINSDRYGIIVKPKGTEPVLDTFYEIRQSRTNPVKIIDAVFRVKKCTISAEKNRTTLWLVKC